jgi:hypothetical protein
MYVPKKRGRKPKNSIVTGGSTAFETPEIGNLIVNIKGGEGGSIGVPGYDETGLIHESVKYVKGSTRCWNCGGEPPDPMSIPYKKIEGVFMVMGSFCSYECGARYLYDTYDNHQLWGHYSILNEYVDEARGCTNTSIEMAPSKYQLKEYGGSMDREEYHQGTTQFSRGRLPISIPSDLVFEVKEVSTHTSKKQLKLYRKKPLIKNNILKNMNTETV